MIIRFDLQAILSGFSYHWLPHHHHHHYVPDFWFRAKLSLVNDYKKDNFFFLFLFLFKQTISL